MDFSVCISVYKNDNAKHFSLALESIVNQSVVPSEIVLVIDGIISKEIENVITDFKNKNSLLKTIYFSKNRGLGEALKIAVENTSYELIARMDSDDIALFNRFEKQLKCFEENFNLSVVGGSVNEFIDNENNIVAMRICPSEDSAIKKYMKSRCGFNHVTVMFKKSEVLRAGNYKYWFWNEDYYLWIRMMEQGCVFKNLPDVLVNVRVGKDMYARRGGIQYFKSEAKLQKYMYQHNIITLPKYLFNVLVRYCVQILMPNSLRGFVFRKLFRKDKNGK